MIAREPILDAEVVLDAPIEQRRDGFIPRKQLMDFVRAYVALGMAGNTGVPLNQKILLQRCQR